MESKTRRDFIKSATLSTCFLPFLFSPYGLSSEQLNDKLSIHIFSKHLQFLDYKKTGEIAAELGFSGVDLTVRPKGHVLPESVKSDLPRAVKEIKASGSICEMITTNVEDAKNRLDIGILEAASNAKIKYYRTNWYKYLEDQSMSFSIAKYQEKIKELGNINKKLNLIGCYQNHAGLNVGASFWEIHQLLELVDHDFFGVQYDIRHAMVEGGLSWENGLKLLQSHIKTIVLKDYKWKKTKGKWGVVNVPLGEGMVDFNRYFKLLKKYKLKPIASLHLEYHLGGAEKGSSKISIDKKIVFESMKKDLSRAQKLWALA